MCPGTGAPQLPQGWKSGACQRLAATRLFCLLRDLRRLGTAMVLDDVQGEKGDGKIAEVGMVSNRCLLIDASLKSIQGRPQVILWSRGSLI